VCDYVEANLHQDISLTELAAITRLSPYHFCRTFKEAVGEPPHRYQINRRIEQAKWCIRHVPRYDGSPF
jgi:AraC family transcriptional regulator